MAHSTNRSDSAPWNDWDESRHGRLDDVSHRGLDDPAGPQQDAELFALSSSGLQHPGDGDSEVSESRDHPAGHHWRLGHHTWHGNEDGQWMVGNDDQDDLFDRAAMDSSQAPSDGEIRGGNARDAEDRLHDEKPSGINDRESPGGSADEVSDGGAEDHQAQATHHRHHFAHSQQVLGDDGSGSGHGEHETRDAGDDQQEDAHASNGQDAQDLNEHHEEHDSDDQQEDAHDANGQDAQDLNEHHQEHDSQGEGSHHCGDQSGNEGLRGQEDDVQAPDGSAHEASASVDADHTQDHCSDSQQPSDNNEDRDDDENPDHDKDHTSDPGRGHGEHDARDGGEDQQGDVHEVNGEDGQEVQQTANEDHQEHDHQAEDSHHCGDESEHEGMRAQDDAVAAFLSSDTLPWKETSEWCASAMGTNPDAHDPPQMSSLVEAWRDEGVMHCELVGHDDAPDVTHANALGGAQPDHGLLSL
jgi:hypothetical protein